MAEGDPAEQIRRATAEDEIDLATVAAHCSRSLSLTGWPSWGSTIPPVT